MCHFFSLVTDPQAQKIMYCNWEDRQRLLNSKDSPDSHTVIANLFGYKGKAEDKLNKYEYNPLTQKFTVDQINNEIDDSAEIEAYCKRLDFKIIVAPLIIKPIIHPFRVAPPEIITPYHLDLLKQWDSVWASVWASVWDSVRASMWDSVRASVWDSVSDSVGASVGGYFGSFFAIDSLRKCQPLLELWNLGLVPSFDGKIWRLHGGPTGQILWEGTIDTENGI